jgi:hypothetical protein
MGDTRITRIKKKEIVDRWKPRYAGLPRLRLGNNGKPWSKKISSLIFVLHGFPFFQAIQKSQFSAYLRNLLIKKPFRGNLCGSESPARHCEPAHPGEAGGSVRDILGPARVLTKGLVLGSSCSGEITIVNQQTQGGGWAYEQDPIS